MTLSESYFYIVVILYLCFALLIIAFTEDLKRKKIFKTYLQLSLIVGCSGIVIELIGWTYFCKYNLGLLSFSPLITLLSSKLITNTFRMIFHEEPYAVWHGRLTDGMWVKNKGDIKRKNYYALYSMAISLIPGAAITFVFNYLENNMCF